jgi:hypothetical protein
VPAFFVPGEPRLLQGSIGSGEIEAKLATPNKTVNPAQVNVPRQNLPSRQS